MQIADSSAAKRISSSPFCSTFEPMNLPIGMGRVLLEARTTRSSSTSVIDGRRSESFREELSLATVICMNSLEGMTWDTGVVWRSGMAVLVELAYDSSFDVVGAHQVDGDQFTLRIAGIDYLARSTSGSNDRFGEWDWTITASVIPLALSDQTIQGEVRMSGRELSIPQEFQVVRLDEYWTGRNKLLFGDNSQIHRSE